MENISFVIVVIGGDRVEATTYWEAEVSRKFDYIADAVVAFHKHGVAVDRVIVRRLDA